MSYATNRSWNVETLKEYTDQRFAASDKAVLAALDAAEKGLNKVAGGTEKRFDQLDEKLEAVQKIVAANGGGQSSAQRIWATALPTLTSVAALVFLIATHK